MTYVYLLFLGDIISRGVNSTNVVKHLTLKEINKLVSEYQKSVKMYRKLIFIRMLYKGLPVSKACSRLGITEVCGYKWLWAWNENGPYSLKPGDRSGRIPRVNIDMLGNFIAKAPDLLKSEKLLSDFINSNFHVKYSRRQIARISHTLKVNLSTNLNHHQKGLDDHRNYDLMN